MNLTKKIWGSYKGNEIYKFELQNGKMKIALCNFGATITGIFLPGKNVEFNNIVLSYDTLEEYIADTFYIGCIIGRFAGRIADAAFTINGTPYTLAKNEGNNIHLHGGLNGFSKQVFTPVEEKITSNNASVKLHYRSAHLEEGYPGNLDVWVTYSLSATDQFLIQYEALSDRDTHINLTNHSYFNLGDRNENILDHELMINADYYLQVDKNHIPTGTIEPVADTAYSFTKLHKISNRQPASNNIFYNDCYVLNNHSALPAAQLVYNKSGYKIHLETNTPALLFYTGDFLSGKFSKNSGLCLEAQFFPDSPNHKTFPNTLLKAGEQWSKFTRLSFFY